MSERRGATLTAALVAGIALALGVNAFGAETLGREQLLQDLAGGMVLALVVWTGLLTLRRSRS